MEFIFYSRGLIKNPNTKVYSHKFSNPDIVYKIGISIYNDCVLWIKGLFVTSRQDFTMFEAKVVFT